MSARQTTRSAPIRDVSGAPATYHPADTPRLPRFWWAHNRDYTVYMLREMSSVFVAIWALRFLVGLSRLRQGRDAYDRFVASERRPLWMLFNVTTLFFAALHSVTFLQAAGMGPRVRFRGRRLSPNDLARGAFAGWGVASLGVALALLVGAREDD